MVSVRSMLNERTGTPSLALPSHSSLDPASQRLHRSLLTPCTFRSHCPATVSRAPNSRCALSDSRAAFPFAASLRSTGVFLVSGAHTAEAPLRRVLHSLHHDHVGALGVRRRDSKIGKTR